jgi:hypothetical protein
MDSQLGQLGFWLFLGMMIAASIVSGALKERDKEREKQALLRALLEKDGKSATEILAYLREKDAAEAAVAAAMNARFRAGLRRLPALTIGIIALWLGGSALAERMDPASRIAMLGISAAGLTIAWWIWRSAKQKDDAHRAA